jgi:hypothetical protein
MNLTIVPTDLLTDYLAQVPPNLAEDFEALHDADISTDSFILYLG